MTLSALCIGTSVGSSEPSKDQINKTKSTKNGLAEVSKWVRAFKIILLVYIKLHDLCLQDEVRKIILSRIFYWILNVELPNKIYFVNLTWFKKLSHFIKYLSLLGLLPPPSPNSKDTSKSSKTRNKSNNWNESIV